MGYPLDVLKIKDSVPDENSFYPDKMGTMEGYDLLNIQN
jgi:hypothetical protein